MHTLHTNYGAADFTAAEMLLVVEMSERIVTARKAATAQQDAEGATWYKYAQEFAQSLAEDLGISAEVAAYIVAGTSNNVTWANQVKWTAPLVRHILAGGSAETAPGPFFTKLKVLTAELLTGNLAALRGEKVTAFARNICGDYTVATIDRWAVRVALGVEFTDENETGKWMRGRRRLLMDAAYHLAAAECELDVAVLQAITWCVIRGTGA